MNTGFHMIICLALLAVCGCTQFGSNPPHVQSEREIIIPGYDSMPSDSIGSTIQEAIQKLGEPDPIAKFRVGPSGTQYLFSGRSGYDYVVCAQGDIVTQVSRRQTTTRTSDNK